MATGYARRMPIEYRYTVRGINKIQDVDGSKDHAPDFGALSNSDTPASALGRSTFTPRNPIEYSDRIKISLQLLPEISHCDRLITGAWLKMTCGRYFEYLES